MLEAKPRAPLASWVPSKFPKTDKPPTYRAKPDFDLFLHIDGSSVVWTLTNTGKLVNQIARLVATVFKRVFYHDASLEIRKDQLAFML